LAAWFWFWDGWVGYANALAQEDAGRPWNGCEGRLRQSERLDWSWSGQHCVRAGEFDTAIASFAKVLEKSSRALARRALYCGWEKRPEEGRHGVRHRIANVGSQLLPDQPVVFARWHWFWMAAGKGEAERAYRTTLQLDRMTRSR